MLFTKISKPNPDTSQDFDPGSKDFGVIPYQESRLKICVSIFQFALLLLGWIQILPKVPKFSPNRVFTAER